MDFQLTDEQVELQRDRPRGGRAGVPAVARAGRRRGRRRHRRALEDARRPRLARPHRARRARRQRGHRGGAGRGARGAGLGGRPDARSSPPPPSTSRSCGTRCRATVRAERLAAIAGGQPGRRGARRPTRSTARADGDGWVLDGTAPHVLDGDRADELAVVAATDDGLGVFLVPGDAVGRDPRAVDRRQPPPRHRAARRRAGARRDRAATGPDVAAGVDRAREEARHRPGRDDGRRLAADLRPRARPRPAPPPVRRAHRLVPGRQAHGRRRVRRHRAGPGAVPLRRARPSPRTTTGARLAASMAKAAAGDASASPPSTASSSSAASATRGRTTCSSTCGGPRPASCSSASAHQHRVALSRHRPRRARRRRSPR